MSPEAPQNATGKFRIPSRNLGTKMCHYRTFYTFKALFSGSGIHYHGSEFLQDSDPALNHSSKLGQGKKKTKKHIEELRADSESFSERPQRKISTMQSRRVPTYDHFH